jgi:vanillate O-demethylase ferredoxin subunit
MNTPSATLEVRVVRKAPVANGIAMFELARVDGQALPAFTAGAHIDVHVPNGMVRQYSLCSDPQQADVYRIAVLHEPASRGGSQGMHELVEQGAVLRISAPRNLFALAPQARRSLLMAGGIGLTPLMSMARVLQREGADFALHYFARSRERAAFVEELPTGPYGANVHVHLDDGPPSKKTDLDQLLQSPADDLHLYTCGPKGFMDAVLSKARALGWADANVHYEFFAAELVRTGDEGEFQVRIASSGQTIAVGAEQTIVAALAAAGVQVPMSCEQGICGTCLTRVVEGEPDHRDMYLTPEEQARNDQMLLCCSRARSACLVLDL